MGMRSITPCGRGGNGNGLAPDRRDLFGEECRPPGLPGQGVSARFRDVYSERDSRVERQGSDSRIYSMIHLPDRLQHKALKQVRSKISDLPNPLWRNGHRVLGDPSSRCGARPGRTSGPWPGRSARPVPDDRAVHAGGASRMPARGGRRHSPARGVRRFARLGGVAGVGDAGPAVQPGEPREVSYHSPPALLRKKLSAWRVVFMWTR